MIQENLFNALFQAMQENKLVFFLGSGFSKECGFPDWRELAEPIAKKLGLNLSDETDYSLIFQYYQDKYKNRNKLNRLLKDTFSSFTVDSQNHNLLVDLSSYGVNEFWTTNYDKSIEYAFQKKEKKIDVKTKNADLSVLLSDSDCTLYKMHGDLCAPEDCVLTKDDYENYEETHEPFINILRHALVEKTILFIGYSMHDPDFQSIVSTVRKYFKNNFSTHYWITRKEETTENLNKQKLFENNLQNYGIQTIELSEFSEITELLKNLILKNKMQTVFISGASVNHNNELDNDRRNFIAELSKRVIEQKLKIINGYGLNVGSSVVEGAYSEIYKNSAFVDSSKYIKIYPFYQTQRNSAERKIFMTKYRTEMIGQTGVAIFVFGTKLDADNKKILSNGMQEEFDIAYKNNDFLIPVGSTGGKSEELWKTVSSNLDLYGYDTDELKELFNKLNDISYDEKSRDDLLDVIFRIIKLKREEK